MNNGGTLNYIVLRLNPETWRYRIGAWHFFYEIHDETYVVFMIAASHRGSAY